MAPRKGWKFGPRSRDRARFGVPRRAGLEKAITAAGMTYQDLAAMLGVHRNTVSKWVRGLTWPSGELLDGLARALEVSEDALDDLIDQVDPAAPCIRRRAS